MGKGDSSFTAPSSYGALSRDGEKASRRCGAGLDSAWNVPPSQVLVVRMLPPDIEEGEVRIFVSSIIFDTTSDLVIDCTCSFTWFSLSLMVYRIFV